MLYHLYGVVTVGVNVPLYGGGHSLFTNIFNKFTKTFKLQCQCTLFSLLILHTFYVMLDIICDLYARYHIELLFLCYYEGKSDTFILWLKV